MLDPVDLVGIGETAGRAVAQHRAVLPACLPQFIDHLHVVLGDLVARVVAFLFRQPDFLCGAVEIARHDVPADPPLGQVIERAHAPGEWVGMFIGQRAGDTEPQILRHHGHGGDQQQRIVHRHLHRAFHRATRGAAEHVVDAEHVGQEHRVDQPALQRAGEISVQ